MQLGVGLGVVVGAGVGVKGGVNIGEGVGIGGGIRVVEAGSLDRGRFSSRPRRRDRGEWVRRMGCGKAWGWGVE